MVHFERDKKHFYVSRCHKKNVGKSETIEKVLKERRKYGMPEYMKTVYVTKRRETNVLPVTEKRLEEKRKHAEAKCEDLAEQWQSLTTKELEFKNVIESFNSFTIQIKQKVNREKAKLHASRENNRSKQVEIDVIKKEIAEYRLVAGQMNKETEKHAIYENFLIHFATSCQFKLVGQVLQRYAILLNAREDLALKLDVNSSTALQFKVAYISFLKRWRADTMRLSNELSQHTEKYDHAKRRVNKWERVVRDLTHHMQKMWVDVNETKNAMEHVVCLLMLRLSPNVTTDVTCAKPNLEKILSKRSGHLTYVNKRLADLEKLRGKIERLMASKIETREEAKKKLSPIDVDDTEFVCGLKGARLEIEKTSNASKPVSVRSMVHFPKISPATAKTLAEIRESILRKKWEKSRTKISRADLTVDERSSSGKLLSKSRSLIRRHMVDKKTKALCIWEFQKAIGSMTDEEVIRSMVYLDPTGESTFLKKAKSQHEFSSAFLTTDPLAEMQIPKEINSKNRRIIERNFDRWEKKFKNPLRQESSSLLKFDKKTGNLILPKLKYSRIHIPFEIKAFLADKALKREKLEAFLPAIVSETSKSPKQSKGTMPQEEKCRRSEASLQLFKNRSTLEDLNTFLNIKILSKFKTDNL